MNNMKNDFQKVVKMFRDNLPKVTEYYSTGEVRKISSPEYPKAMMTDQQMRKNTATINFGWNSEKALDKLETFKKYEPFVIWCESYKVKNIGVELNSDNRYQLRINF